MKKNDYEALIEERHLGPAEIARRRDAERLAEIARNLKTLAERAEGSVNDGAEGEAKPQAPEKE